VVLSGFERRLERLVEGTFGRAFRSGLQPVEIGRRVVRALDAGTQVGLRGTVAPNRFVVHLATEDHATFTTFADSLGRELADAARDHAHDRGHHFLGPVQVELVTDPARRRGDVEVVATVVEGPPGWRGALRLPDGSRLELGDGVVVFGRLPGCTVQLSDNQASRRHAEIRADRDGYALHDLGSTNGTFVNEVRTTNHHLVDGDEIRIGSSVVRYEES
jgi:hypothetical protein